MTRTFLKDFEMDDKLIRKMIGQLAYIKENIESEADSDSDFSTAIINDTSLYEDARHCGELLKEIAAVSPEYSLIVAEEVIEAKESVYGRAEDEEDDEEDDDG